MRPVIHRPLTPVTYMMSQQRGDSFEAHAAVDGLGGQRVAEPVW